MDQSDEPTPLGPMLPPDLHPELVRECQEWWMKDRPYTKLRVLRVNTDNPEGASCVGSQGNFGTTCQKKVEAVQYTTTGGNPQYYCEEHAIQQASWDVVFYEAGPRPTPPMTPEQEAWLSKLRTKNRRPEPIQDEPEEIE